MRSCLVFICFTLGYTLNASPIRAIQNGEWSNPTTWSCQCVPGNADHIVIPTGVVVQSAQTIFLNFGPKIAVMIDGVLELKNTSVYLDDEDLIALGEGGKIMANGVVSVLYSGSIPFFVSMQLPVNGPATVFSGKLPDGLISFKAEAQNFGALLKWSSLAGKGDQVFTLQYSTDGIHFESLTEMGAGNKFNERMEYCYEEKRPIDGMVYYRLIQRSEEQENAATTITYTHEGKRKKTF